MTNEETLKFLKIFKRRKGITRAAMEKYLQDKNIFIDDFREIPITRSMVVGDPKNRAACMEANSDDILILTDEGINRLNEQRKQNLIFWIPIGFSNAMALAALIKSFFF